MAAALPLHATVPPAYVVRGNEAACNIPGCVLEAVGPDGVRVLAKGAFRGAWALREGERLRVTVR